MENLSPLSPREIVQGLDLEEIDRSIEEVNGELAALKALRKVAESNGRKSGGRGNASSASEKMSTAERLELAFDVLSESGSMSYRDLAERVGYQPAKAFWILRAVQKDDRFCIGADGETISLC